MFIHYYNIFFYFASIMIFIFSLKKIKKKKLIFKNELSSYDKNLDSNYTKYLFNNIDKLHVIFYADQKFEKAKLRVFNEAINSKWFYSITPYGPNNLSKSFTEEYNEILKMKRGGGYWIWKYYIILSKLNEIKNNEFLIYIDCGCNINLHGEKRLEQYLPNPLSIFLRFRTSTICKTNAFLYMVS